MISVGNTTCAPGDNGSHNMSAEQLCEDTLYVLNSLFSDLPNVILAGHSLGGAIAVRVSLLLANRVKGLIVLDVVEGTAIESLPRMVSFLATRPKSFSTIPDAILWSITSGSIRKKESACVSIPPQISESGDKFVWKTDLAATEPFWEGWFHELSKLFLKVVSPKVLILAGTDRLDKEMTIAQMQGKFQLEVLANCGHQIQEDDPLKISEILTQFLQRYKILTGVETLW